MSKVKVYRPVAAEFPISSPYGVRIHPLTKKTKMHWGVDFAVPIGTPIVAAVTGTIDVAGWENSKQPKQGFGIRVRQYLVHEGRACLVFYAHLSEVSVKQGEEVVAGTRIGLSGDSGASSGPHMHFEVRPTGGQGIEPEFIS